MRALQALRRKLIALWSARDFDIGAIALVIAQIRSLLNMPEQAPPDAGDEPPRRPRNKGESPHRDR
jgi:hypothetical protein